MASSSGISFSGLFSGLDTDSIISQLMTIERQPQSLLKDKKVTLGYQKEGILAVNNSMLSLKETIQSFKSGLVKQNSAVSTDEDVVTATANSGATEGAYTINVLSMASAHRVGSDTQAGNYAGAGGTMQITIGANTFNVNVANGQSLDIIARSINTSTDGATGFMDKALATVINDPLTGNKTLVIESNDTGSANAISISDTAGTSAQDLGLITGIGAINHEFQAAQDASIDINGVVISNSTNYIKDAVYGVEFNITGYGSAKVSVGPDDSGTVAKVKAFIDQFNKTTALIDGYVTQEKVDNPTTEDELKAGVLQNDSDMSWVKSEIRVKTTGYMDSSLAKYKILQSIGIDSEESNGSVVSNNLTLDEDKLKAALADDKDQVFNLLNGWADQLDNYLESETKVSVTDSLAGNFYRKVLSIDSSVSYIDDEISNWDTRLTAIEERYRTQFTQMETLLQEMQTQSNYLSNQLSKLSSSSSNS